MSKFKLKKDKFDFGNKGKFNFNKKNDYSKTNNYKGSEYDDNEHNRAANETEGTIEEQKALRKKRNKVDPDAPGTPGQPGYEPPVKRSDLDAKGKALWDKKHATKKKTGAPNMKTGKYKHNF